MHKANTLNHIPNAIALDPALLQHNHGFPTWLPQKRSIILSCARHGLFQGLKMLNLPTDSKVLVPAFVCNTVTDPLRLAGAKLVFYRVNSDLSPDLNHAEELLKKSENKKIHALLWYHYLGFSFGMAEAQKFCRIHKINFIEDGAHAIPGGTQKNSKNAPGSWGDFAVFSIRKFLPVTNAGAIIVNNKNLLPLPDIQWRKQEKIYLKNLHDKEKMLCGLFDRQKKIAPPYIKKSIKKHFLYVTRLNSENKIIRESTRAQIYNADMNLKYMVKPIAPDIKSLHVIRNVNLNLIIETRRNNYNAYLNEIGDLALFPKLPPDVVPLGISILVPDRNAFRLRLAQCGVESTTHWPDWLVPEGARRGFTNEKNLADHLLTLPCHQGLNLRDIQYVCQAVKKSWKN